MREQKRRVEAVVKMREIPVLGAHAPAAIEHKDDLLVALIFVFARGGFPVDLPAEIALAIIAKMRKFHAAAAPAKLSNAEIADPIGRGEQHEAADGLEIWQHPKRLSRAVLDLAHHQAQRAQDANIG